jgi:glycine C-acetyltransferase
MSQSLFRSLSKRHTTLQKEGLEKQERILFSPQGAEIALRSDQWIINLGADNYLGLADDGDVIHAAEQGLREWGFGMASARFNCGTQDVHKRLEARIADFLGTEQAMLFSSCFDAHAGLFESILGDEDAVFSDAFNHASMFEGIRLSKAKLLRYRNNDMEDLEACLVGAKDARYRLIATDGVFSMDGTIANLASICDLAEKYDALVMVHDSHGVGILGDQGRGTPEHLGVSGRVHILTGSLGKALGGASGGYIAARSEIISWLRQRARPYLFSNSLAPSLVAASIKALELVEEGEDLRRRLRENSLAFRLGLAEAGFNLVPGQHPIIPILIGDAHKANEMSEKLLNHGVHAIAFTYPLVPEGQARIRVQITSSHTQPQLDMALDAFIKAGREAALIT